MKDKRKKELVELLVTIKMTIYAMERMVKDSYNVSMVKDSSIGKRKLKTN